MKRLTFLSSRTGTLKRGSQIVRPPGSVPSHPSGRKQGVDVSSQWLDLGWSRGLKLRGSKALWEAR